MTDPHGLSPEDAPPEPTAPEPVVVRRKRKPARRRHLPVVPILAVATAVAVGLLVFGSSRAIGLRPTVGDAGVVGDAGEVGAAVDPLPSAGCAGPADPAASPSDPGPDSAQSAGPTDPALPTARYPTVTDATGPRAYRFVDGGSRADGDPPGLVLALPDQALSAEDFANRTGLELVAASLGYSVATLEPVPPERRLNASQEVGRPDDILHAVTVIEDVAATRCVDLRRVHAVGHGVGGRLGGALACVRPEYLASVVAVGGAFLADPCPLEPPVSLLAVGAADDPIAPLDAPDGPAAVAERWAERLGTAPPRSVPAPAGLPVAGVSVEQWSEGRLGASVDLARIPSGGHDWPGWINEPVVAYLEDHARTT